MELTIMISAHTALTCILISAAAYTAYYAASALSFLNTIQF